MLQHIIGVDPGLVHTGVVSLEFNTKHHEIDLDFEVVQGPDAEAVRDWITKNRDLPPTVFIEKYVPRQNLGSDARMVTAEAELRRLLPKARFIRNTGSKQIVSPVIMELLGVWSFPTSTHHQDLRAAARIALFGMMKDEHLNRVLANVVQAHLDGQTWQVWKKGAPRP